MKNKENQLLFAGQYRNRLQTSQDWRILFCFNSAIFCGGTMDPQPPQDAPNASTTATPSRAANTLSYFAITGVDKSSVIEESASLGKNLYIGANVYIGHNSKIGDNCKIYPNTYIGDNVSIGEGTTLFSGVNIYSESIIGKECTFHAGVIIGSDGFGFAPQNQAEFKKVPQIGNVIVEDHVEIGANTTIDKATMGSTIIRKGVKLDNLVQIAHNVDVGEKTVMAAQTGIAGSTKIGKECMFGGQVGIVGHITIADKVKIAAQSGVNRATKEGMVLIGSPAIDAMIHTKSFVLFKKFPEIYSKLNNLEKAVAKITKEK